MKRFGICFLLALLLCCAGCSSWKWKEGKKKDPALSGKSSPEKAKKKKKADTSWIREQFHREQISDKSMNARILDDFEVIPGHKGYRSRTLRDQDPISLW